MVDLCCVGHITRDRIITPHQPPVECAGGTSYYVAWALSALPHDIHFQLVTAVGPESADEIARLREAGVQVKCFDSPHSVFFVNEYGENMNDRQQKVLASAAPFTVEQIRGLDAKVFHLGSLLGDDFSPEVVRELARRGRVSVDVQGYLRMLDGERVRPCEWKDKADILRHTAILKLNEHESRDLTGLTDPRSIARQIRKEWNVEEVIVTLGSYGSVIYAEDRFYDIPAYRPRQTVDATGCGDTYSAGYLYARAHGESYEDSGKFAAAMCTLKLEHTGPFDRTADDIHKIMSNLY